MKAKIAKLIDVKSIMTLLLTIVFCVLALVGVISGQEFVTIFTVVVGFYFGTQSGKKAEAPKQEPQPEAVEQTAIENRKPPDSDSYVGRNRF